MSVIGSNVLAGASGQAGGGGYEIERSLRFNSADSPYLSKSFASAGNRRTWTLSCWYKPTLGSASRNFLFVGESPGNVHAVVNFYSNKFEVYRYAGGHTFQFITTPVFRDPSAWYHIVLAWDTTQATASNRIKLYINGELVDTLDAGYTSNYPSQNAEYEWNNAQAHGIGGYSYGGNADQYLADYHFIDSQALDSSSFGAPDDNGVWQPIKYAGTYGPNQSQTWSSNITQGAFNNVANMFDGSLSTVSYATTQPGTVTWSPITVASKVRLYGRGNGSSWNLTINGSSVNIPFVSGNSWVEVTTTGSLTAITNTANNGAVLAIEADGRLLIDSGVSVGNNSFHLDFKDNSSNAALGTDTSGNSNTWTVNNLTASARKWSSYLIPQSPASFDSSYPASKAFDGSISAGNVAKLSSGSYADKYIDFIPTGGIVFSSQLEIYVGASNFEYSYNGGSNVAASAGAWHTVASGAGTLTSIRIQRTQSQTHTWRAMRVDGTILIDGDPASIDSLVDSPSNGTQTDTGAGGEVVGNYATLNPLQKNSGVTLLNGNLTLQTTSSAWKTTQTTIGMKTGKYYWEFGPYIWKDNSNHCQPGIAGMGIGNLNEMGATNYSAFYHWSGTKFFNGQGGVGTAFGDAWNDSEANIIGIAFDADTRKVWFSKNGVWQGSGNPSAGTNEAGILNLYENGTYSPTLGSYGSLNGGGAVTNFGQRAFAYTAPTNFKALNTANLPEPTIADGSKYFDTKLWSGNNSTQAITGLGFSPDFVWAKARNSTNWHELYDTVRGNTVRLFSNTADGDNSTSGLASFDTNGFTLNNATGINNTSSTNVGWAWDAGANSDKTYAITVANPGSGNKFYADGALQPTLTLAEGSTYKFDQSASSNASHPLRFSTTNNGTHGGGSEYTTGVTTAGTPGSAGAFTQIVIAASAPTLYAYCTAHSGMGFQINTSDKGGFTIPVGSLTSSVYNQSQTWSNLGSNGGSGYSHTRATDGNFTTQTLPDVGATTTWNFGSTFSSATKVRFYAAYGGSPAANVLKIDGVDVGSSVTATGYSYTWSAEISVSGFTTITNSRPSGGQLMGITAIEVDGKLLVDSGVSVTTVPTIASQVMASPESGFSIVNYTGTGANASVGHGLNDEPHLIFTKNRDASNYGWYTYAKAIGNDKYLVLEDTTAASSFNLWQNTTATSSVFYLSSNAAVMQNNADYVAYCFAPVEGYSAMGSYEGNGSADGPFIYTGFKVAWLMTKNIDNYGSGYDWHIYDDARNISNVCKQRLNANLPNGEDTYDAVDFLSNGFKIRNLGGSINQNAHTHVYLAFASNPFASNGGLAR